MSVTVTQQLTQQTVTVTGNPVENNVTVTVSNARGPAGPNVVNASTTSDGTANLSLAAATVSGMLTAPTAATTTSTTPVATTEFVQQELASGVAVAKNLEFLAYNGSGATIAKGSIVYINGAVGGVPRITKSQANNDTNSARTIGFVKADITNGSNGFVIIEGELLNVSTADSISIVGAGIQLYLSPTTPGAFTRTKPSAPSHMVYVGVVVTASTGVALDGKILVGIQNGYELDEIHDVSITAPVAAKQVVKRNAGNTLWINSAIVSADVSDATDAATANTLVLRDANGNASFGQIFSFSLTVTGGTTFGEESLIQFDAVEYYYGDGAASAHRIALGAGTTGATLFGAADAAAARTTLGLATADSPTFAGLTASGAVKVGTATTADATSDVLIATSATTQRGLTIQGKASQAGNLLRIVEHTNNAENNGWEFSASSVTLATSGTKIYFNASTLILSPSFLFGFSSSLTNPFAAKTLGFAATSAGSGVLEINNGTLGTLRDLTLRNLTASGTLAVTGATTLTGAVTTANFIAGAEMTAPAAPAANGYKIYAEDNGAGKTRLMVLFATGAAQQIAIEP